MVCVCVATAAPAAADSDRLFIASRSGRATGTTAAAADYAATVPPVRRVGEHRVTRVPTAVPAASAADGEAGAAGVRAAQKRQ